MLYRMFYYKHQQFYVITVFKEKFNNTVTNCLDEVCGEKSLATSLQHLRAHFRSSNTSLSPIS